MMRISGAIMVMMACSVFALSPAPAMDGVPVCQVLTLEDDPLDNTNCSSGGEGMGFDAPIETTGDATGPGSEFDDFDGTIPQLDSITPMLQTLLEKGDFMELLESGAFDDLVDLEALRNSLRDGSLKDLSSDGNLDAVFNSGAVDRLLGDENFQKLMASPQFQQLITRFSSMDMDQEIDMDSVQDGTLGTYLDSVMEESGHLDSELLDSVQERFEIMEELLEE